VIVASWSGGLAIFLSAAFNREIGSKLLLPSTSMLTNGRVRIGECVVPSNRVPTRRRKLNMAISGGGHAAIRLIAVFCAAVLWQFAIDMAEAWIDIWSVRNQ